jgi:hypothetical protein
LEFHSNKYSEDIRLFCFPSQNSKQASMKNKKSPAVRVSGFNEVGGITFGDPVLGNLSIKSLPPAATWYFLFSSAGLKATSGRK